MNFLKQIVILSFIFQTGLAVAQREERSLSSFNKIRVGQAVELELIKGTTEKAVVEISGSIDLDEVITEVRGETLKIGIDRDRIRGSIDVRVILTYKSLRGISISSAADVYARETINGDDFFVDVSSAGSGELDLNVSSLELEASSAGSIEISGKSKYLNVSVSSAGSIRAYDLDTEEADVRASSAGSVKISVSKQIDARASSGGSIRYKGNPDKEYTNSSSGGSVRRY